MAHTSTNKKKLVARVRRIAGQLGAIERAIESDTDCSQVLQQVAAARGAMGGLLEELIEDHLRHHVAHPELSDADRQNGAEELIAIIRRYSR
ncbi:metal/formaldehyde-sensitive transcriptional repressor [Brevundimonas diminuta]|uniref:Metal/formaldehyde-sensitive transcriptional repressor n=1 Tax=Brevundimonas diminuta TaxID=293 RepID=A0A410NZ19_BREDI|nr:MULTISPECIES: metal/formaldehyde-sensitive transcriptional repressor [Brevundimonas]EKY23959.1 putative transcriptional repressor FrmR [Brevundimonas diminuta 470-4]MBD3572566.1 metal/formaldehyde-sensitive transcriptional repressor [Brevundimonas diminuta]MBD3819177.1 metal/formaldehyde-sensitive transcriptional repressor [Brevundimonas diminuta]QAT15097.1 metal/formaldehyde-sensitive transcriptional repressor [Brevundimonas diminuta]QQB87520.1 metal/formaldehyde-sensitive transcriptional 